VSENDKLSLDLVLTVVVLVVCRAVVPRCNVVQLGRCNVGQSKTASFTMTNHSNIDSVRFQWPEHPTISFSPRLGHLHPGRTKVIHLPLSATCLTATYVYVLMIVVKLLVKNCLK